MRIPLFSQSLFSLDLSDAIAATGKLGFYGIELACREPHFDLKTAQTDPVQVANEIREAGLVVSALSL